MAEKLEFDSAPAPSASGGGRQLEFDEAPKSGGAYAAKELPTEMQLRADRLRQILDAKGEPGYGARLVDNFTMGINRPLSGVASMVSGPGTAGERYRAGVGAEEDYIKRAERNTNPYAGAAVDVLGGLAAGGPAPALVRGAASVARQAPSRLGQIYRSMTGAAGSGAIEGAARNAESVENAAVGAGVGGTVGGVVGGAAGAVTSRLPGVRGAQKEVNEAVREGGSKGLKEEGGAIYQKLDQAGIKFKDTDTPALVTNTAQKMADKGFNREIHKELIPALEQIGALKGQPATWTQLQNIRTQISDAKASDDKRVRKMAGHLGGVLDDFVENTRPVVPPRSVGINVGEESQAARDLWRRGSLTENVEYLGQKGMVTAKDPGNKLRTNFGRELDRVDKPGRLDPYSPEQKGLVTEIAKGDPNLSRAASGLNRWGNNLIGYGTAGAAGGAGLAHAFGDQYGVGAGSGAAPGMAAIGAGLLAKRGGGVARNMIANRGQERVNDLVRNIVTGSTDRSVINTPRDALAKVLAAEQLKRAGARYSSNFFDRE